MGAVRFSKSPGVKALSSLPDRHRFHALPHFERQIRPFDLLLIVFAAFSRYNAGESCRLDFRTLCNCGTGNRNFFAMVAMASIEEFGRRIGREFGAERVILFGSHAHGAVTEDSDVDLLVIGSFEGRSVDRSVEIRMKLRPQFPVDLLVRTAEKVRERIQMGDDFMREIVEEGKVLYEANDR